MKFKQKIKIRHGFLGRIVHQIKQKLYLLRAQCMFITSININQKPKFQKNIYKKINNKSNKIRILKDSSELCLWLSSKLDYQVSKISCHHRSRKEMTHSKTQTKDCLSKIQEQKNQNTKTQIYTIREKKQFQVMKKEEHNKARDNE